MDTGDLELLGESRTLISQKTYLLTMSETTKKTIEENKCCAVLILLENLDRTGNRYN